MLIAATVICLRQQRGAHVGRALERHVRHLHARGALEHQHHQVIVGADAGRADGDLARIGFRVRGQSLQVAELRVRVHREIARVVDHVAEQLEALRPAELRGALDRHGDERRRIDEADGVAVGRGVGDRGEADLAAGARAMHDDDLRAAADVLLEVRLDRARDEIRPAAGRVADDEVDRLVRVRRRRGAWQGKGHGEQQPVQVLHGRPPPQDDPWGDSCMKTRAVVPAKAGPTISTQFEPLPVGYCRRGVARPLARSRSSRSSPTFSPVTTMKRPVGVDAEAARLLLGRDAVQVGRPPAGGIHGERADRAAGALGDVEEAAVGRDMDVGGPDVPAHVAPRLRARHARTELGARGQRGDGVDLFQDSGFELQRADRRGELVQQEHEAVVRRHHQVPRPGAGRAAAAAAACSRSGARSSRRTGNWNTWSVPRCGTKAKWFDPVDDDRVRVAPGGDHLRRLADPAVGADRIHAHQVGAVRGAEQPAPGAVVRDVRKALGERRGAEELERAARAIDAHRRTR